MTPRNPSSPQCDIDIALRNDSFLKSSYMERLVEHVFISEVLQEAWYSFGEMIEVLRSEVDASGYDVVFECKGFVRHVQLKTSAGDARRGHQNVNVALANKPSGCIIWIVRHEDRDSGRMSLSYRFFGGSPGCRLPSLESLKVAKHAKGNATGKKAERPGIRVVPKGMFTPIATTSELLKQLFGEIEDRRVVRVRPRPDLR